MICTAHLLPDPVCLACQVHGLTQQVEALRQRPDVPDSAKVCVVAIEAQVAAVGQRLDVIFRDVDRRFNALEAHVLRLEMLARTPIRVVPPPPDVVENVRWLIENRDKLHADMVTDLDRSFEEFAQFNERVVASLGVPAEYLGPKEPT